MKGMILFQEDWDLHPTAFPDLNTGNVSYLRASALLRDMGIKNHKFMLALHNKALVGVDPHDPNLSGEQMLAIAQECYDNYWYFVREVVRAPGNTYDIPLKYLANRANLCLHWLYMQHIFTILTQIRQTGKSFGIAIPHLWQLHVRSKKHKIIGLTKDMSLRSAHLSLVKSLDEELPFYMRQRTEADAANTEIINISRLGNELVMFVPSRSPKQADRVGRGHVAADAWVDEGPYVPNLHISLQAMLAATNKARLTAEMKNEPYCTVMTSTVGDLATPEGEFYFKLTQNSAEFTEYMYDCRNREELLNMIRKQCRSIEETTGKKVPIRVYAEFNHRQLGVTDEQVADWVAESAATDGADSEKDYFNKWKFGGSGSALTEDQRKLVESSVKEPGYPQIDSSIGYLTKWYLPKQDVGMIMENMHTSWGLDTSDAVGSDGIALVGRLVDTGQVIGVLTINETFIPTFIAFLFRFLKDHPKALLIPERKSSGPSIIDGLLVMMIEAGINPFRRIYNNIIQNKQEHEELFKVISKPSFCDAGIILSNKRHFGFATSGSGATARSGLFAGTMNEAIRITGDSVYDKTLANQLQSLVIDENNRVDHRPGMHDDAVIAWLLSFWFITHGKNLDYYGLDYKTILRNNAVNAVDNDPRMLAQQKKIAEINAKIEAYIEVYNTCGRNDFVRAKVSQELQSLYAMLPEDTRRSSGFDDIMANLNEERKVEMMMRRSSVLGRR